MMVLLLLILVECAFGQLGTPPPDISQVGVDGVMRWARQRTTDALTSFGAPRQPSPEAWEDQVVYSIMVDRFANGNVSNDELNTPLAQQQYRNSSSTSPFGLDAFRHGGDLAGIIPRLPYLRDLGVTTLWLTPVLRNCAGEYHGYCPSDYAQLDPGFGTMDEYRQLVRAAHAAGLLVVQDVVVNHACGCFTRYGAQPGSHAKCASVLDAQFWAGQVVGNGAVQGNISFSPSFFGPFRSEFFFNRCGQNTPGDTSGTGPAAVYGDFVSSMLDFASYNQDLQQVLTELFKGFVALTDVDGLRLDAVKHVTEDFVAYLSTEMRDFARTSLGKDKFFVVGEVAGPADWIGRRLGKQFSDPDNPGSHGNVPGDLTQRLFNLQSVYSRNPLAHYPGLDAVYDFDASGTSRDALLGLRPSSDVASYFASDYYNTIAGNGNPKTSWTHLEIHDWDRFQKGRSDMQMSIVAAAYLLTAPGQPIIWMGFEQGFNQNCHFDSMNASDATASLQDTCEAGSDDTLKRQDMFAEGPWRLGSCVPQIDALNYIGNWRPAQTTTDWQRDPFLNREHALFRFVRKLVHIRRSCSALRRGDVVWRNAQPQVNGLLVFSRVDRATGREVVVVINPAKQGTSTGPIPLENTPDKKPFQVWVNLINGFDKATVGFQGSACFLYLAQGFVIAPQSFLILVNADESSPYDSYLDTMLCSS